MKQDFEDRERIRKLQELDLKEEELSNARETYKQLSKNPS